MKGDSSKAAKGDPFARLYHSFIDDHLQPLSNGAQVLYIGFLRRFNGHNGSGIAFSVRDAATWCKCGKSTAQAYFRELECSGLIEPVTKGAFKIKAGELKNFATTWRLPAFSRSGVAA